MAARRQGFASFALKAEVFVDKLPKNTTNEAKSQPKNNILFSTAKLYAFVEKKDVVTASIHPRLNRGILEAFNKQNMLQVNKLFY